MKRIVLSLLVLGAPAGAEELIAGRSVEAPEPFLSVYTLSPSQTLGQVTAQQLLTRRSSPIQVALQGGLVRTADGYEGAFMQAATRADFGRLRLGAVVTAQHLNTGFGHDAADYSAVAGASLQVASPLRLGVEYLGRDLEGMMSDDAEGGAHHFVGSDATLELQHRRLLLTAGALMQVDGAVPVLSGRATLTYLY